MSYQITFANGNVYTTLGPGVIDSKLGLSLIGSNTVNYGQLLANNFVRLLENQANNIAPTFPIAGQLWWNTGTQVLSYFDGNKFKPCSSSQLGPTPPPSPLDGDQWWDTSANQLNIFNGNVWTVIGPGYTKGQGISGISNTLITGTNGQHLVSELQLNGNVIAIISNDGTFSLTSNIAGITTVQPGINLIPTAVLNGTSVNSQQLLGSTWSSPGTIGNVTPAAAVFTTLISTTLTVGNINLSPGSINASPTFTVGSGNATITTNSTNGTITVSNDPVVSKSIATKNYVDVQDSATVSISNAYTNVVANTLLGPSSTLITIGDLSNSIGNDPNFSINVYNQIGAKASTFNPTFTGNVSVVGSILPTANITSDIGSPSRNFQHIYSAAISSVFADLAEKYESDNEYEPGTVVVFGGGKEITISSEYCDSRIAGVVSKDPAYTMNDKSAGLAIALTGKVLCKIVGPVKKGDVLVNSSILGVATSFDASGRWVPGCVIGKSLEDNNNTELRNIMISVGRF